MSGRDLRRMSLNDVKIPTNMMKEYSMAFLEEVSNQDEASFYEFFQGLDLDDVKNARDRRRELQEKNRELAVANSELEPKFIEKKEELRRKCAQAAELKEEYQKRFEELKKYQSRSDPPALKKQLQDSAKQTEKNSEDLASDFVGGKSALSLEDFIEEFHKQRTLYWLRKVKSEKLDELLKNRKPIPAPRSRPPPPNPAQSLPPSSHPTPYPVDTRRPSEPLSSVPPYPQSGMPMPNMPPPGHPFTPAYASYTPGAYQPRPAPYPVSRSYGHRY